MIFVNSEMKKVNNVSMFKYWVGSSMNIGWIGRRSIKVGLK